MYLGPEVLLAMVFVSGYIFRQVLLTTAFSTQKSDHRSVTKMVFPKKCRFAK